MKGYIQNIMQASEQNENFRKVLYTDAKLQLVVMSLDPGQDIGAETHEVDQFIHVEKGRGQAVLAGEIFDINERSAVIVPAGTKHNIMNSGEEKMKLFTLYTPPEHANGTVHATKEDAEKDEM